MYLPGRSTLNCGLLPMLVVPIQVMPACPKKAHRPRGSSQHRLPSRFAVFEVVESDVSSFETTGTLSARMKVGNPYAAERNAQTRILPRKRFRVRLFMRPCPGQIRAKFPWACWCTKGADQT
jgi:hypothetical protein